MFANFIVLIVLVALVILFGWLTYRAIRSSKLWVKIVGGILGVVATLIFAGAAFTFGKGLLEFTRPHPVAAVNVVFEHTPEQVARGEHLAGILCASCHSMNGELPLTGGKNLSEDSGLPLGDLYPPNITSGGRLKELTDADVFRILRSGVDPQGRLTAMGFFPVRALSDDDAKAVIAYLRQAPAVEKTTPPLSASPLLVAFTGLGFTTAPGADQPIAPVTAPPKAANIEYGKYVADFGDCRGCHGEKLDGNAPPPAPPGATNLTVVVPQWSKDDFFKAMRTGVDPGGNQIQPPMPWQTIGKLDDVELEALYLYLHSLPPLLPNK